MIGLNMTKQLVYIKNYYNRIMDIGNYNNFKNLQKIYYVLEIIKIKININNQLFCIKF